MTTALETLLCVSVALQGAFDVILGWLLILVLRRMGDGTKFFRDRTKYSA